MCKEFFYQWREVFESLKQKLSKLPNSTLAIYNVNNIPIENVDNERLLGVCLDNSLQYTKHIDNMCRFLSSKVALLKRIKQFLPLYYRKMYFNAYILPSIDYCLTIWGNAPKCHLDRILKFQKYAARIILDTPPDSPSEPLFKKLGWLNIYEGVQNNKTILLYKAVHGMTPGYFWIVLFLAKLQPPFFRQFQHGNSKTQQGICQKHFSLFWC